MYLYVYISIHFHMYMSTYKSLPKGIRRKRECWNSLCL